MATPMLRALRKQYGPQAHLVGVMRPLMADLLAGTSWLDEHIYYHPHSKNRALQSWSVTQKLRAKELGLIVLTTNSLRAAVIAWLSGAPQRVGYVRYGRGPFLTNKLFQPKIDGQHVPCRMVDYYLQLAYAVGCATESPRVELATTFEEERSAEEVWKSLGLRQRVVTFNSSGAYGAAKLWPVEYFADLSRRISRELDHDVLVICGPAELERAKAIVQRSGDPRVFCLAEQSLSLGLSKACVRRSRLLVTTDSGPRQFAVAFNVPIVGVYGALSITVGTKSAGQGCCTAFELGMCSLRTTQLPAWASPGACAIYPSIASCSP